MRPDHPFSREPPASAGGTLAGGSRLNGEAVATMERAAFARARSFLNYHPVAKWAALVAGVGTGVLYVVLLLLLGLFLDLTINRGEIPAYQNLSPPEQRAFREEWKVPLSHFSGTLQDGAVE